MKNQKTQNKLIVAMSAVILLLVALSATFTFAYFTATNNATKSGLQFGNLTMQLLNAADQAMGEDALPVSVASGCEIGNLMPGCVLTPNGGLKVTSSIDAYLRIKFTITVTGGTGAAATAANLLSYMNTESLTNGTYKFTSGSDATAGSTGWLYAAIPSTESAAIEVVDLDAFVITLAQEVIGNDWQNATASIRFDAQIIQAEHLKSKAITAEASEAALGEGNGFAAVEADTIIDVSKDSTTTALTAAEAYKISQAKAWDVTLTTGLPA